MDDGINKLVLPSGMSSKLQDLVSVIQETFHIPDGLLGCIKTWNLRASFITLSCIEEVEDKGTLKVVLTKPLVLTLSPVEGSDVDFPRPEQSSDTQFCNSSASQDTILLSSSDESGIASWSQPWPAKFEIFTFSYDVAI